VTGQGDNGGRPTPEAAHEALPRLAPISDWLAELYNRRPGVGKGQVRGVPLAQRRNRA